VIWDLMRTLDRTRTIVTHDSGNPRDQIVPFWESLIPHGYIGWGKSTQLGYSLGLAMGAKLAAPDKQVVHFMGDAAFGMCGMDVETAARERIPILTVIVNNSALGGYEKYMPIATERYGTKFLTGSYAGVATALGAFGERVEQPSEIVPAIRRAEAALADGKPAVLEMITREEPTFSKHW
jgi:thiamine pyrophosphate-dependent acetolactate synthase large subunit-like protein